MSRFLQIASGVDMLPLKLDLHRAPHLWDQNTTRKTYPGTPHAAMSDIWVRFRAKNEIVSMRSHQEPHRNVFWPAWAELPSLRPLILGRHGLVGLVGAVELGSILITRLPPGESILPHADKGWAPEFYNCKVHLTASGVSMSRCEDETITMRTGEAWTFDNTLEHEVENPGTEDRIVVIVSMRVET